MIDKNDVFIFTEAYNCGLILKQSLESFHKYNNYKVNIFCTQKDMDEIGEIKNHENNIFHILDTNEELKHYYNFGHKGTSYIFAKNISKEHKYVIHFDSDTYFRADCISEIINKFEEYDIIGTRRCYKYNLNKRDDIRHQPDTINTFLFGFKPEFVSNVDFDTYMRMCEGTTSITGDIILDFFDPVVYDALRNGAKITFLDFNDYGCFNEKGSKNNDYSEYNNMFDVGHKIIHFAGVGSGYNNFNKNLKFNGYQTWSIERWLIYNHVFYEQCDNDNIANGLKNILNI